MVSTASALGRNGIQDWLLLRASAIIIALYVFYLFGFFAITPNVTYEIWQHFFASAFTKIFTLLTLFSILIHAWIGLWQVFTDYVKSLPLRLLLQLLVLVVLMVYVFYGTMVVWSV